MLSGFYTVGILILLVLILNVHLYFTKDLEWENINISILAAVEFPSLISSFELGVFRALAATLIWASISYLVLDPLGLPITVRKADGQTRSMLLKGFDRLTMYTVWSWILQGIYFTLAAIASFLHSHRNLFPKEYYTFFDKHLACWTWISFEISFPVAFLVSGVVTYVLIPLIAKDGLPVDTFFTPMALIMHNINVLFMAIEFCTNQIHFSYYHFIYMLFYSIAYVVFAWIWNHHKGIFYYFFLDYQRKGAVFWYLGLLLGVTGLFFAGFYASIFKFHETYNLYAKVFVAVLTALTMKWTR